MRAARRPASVSWTRTRPSRSRATMSASREKNARDSRLPTRGSHRPTTFKRNAGLPRVVPAGKCDFCGVEEYMPYVCKFCKGRYCAAHRLPENHNCAQLGAYKDRVRAEGKVFAPPQEARVTPRVT